MTERESPSALLERAATTETPIEKWHRLHPGTLIEGWVVAMAALDDIQSDWAYQNGPLNLPERYDGRHGWWL